MVFKGNQHPLLQAGCKALQNGVDTAVQGAVDVREGDVARQILRCQMGQLFPRRPHHRARACRNAGPAAKTPELFLAGLVFTFAPAWVQIAEALWSRNAAEAVDGPEVAVSL